jgi:Toprim domain
VAALSAGHLAAWEFPQALRRLVISCDNDGVGRRAARRLSTRAERARIETTTIISLRSDFNSDLRRMSREAFRRRLEALLKPHLDRRQFENKVCVKPLALEETN